MEKQILPCKRYAIKSHEVQVGDTRADGYIHYDYRHSTEETAKLRLYRSSCFWRFEKVDGKDKVYKIINQRPGKWYGAGLALDEVFNPKTPETDIMLHLSKRTKDHLEWRFDEDESGYHYLIINVTPGNGYGLHLSMQADVHGDRYITLRKKEHSFIWELHPFNDNYDLSPPNKINAIIGKMHLIFSGFFLAVENGEPRTLVATSGRKENKNCKSFIINHIAAAKAYTISPENKEDLVICALKTDDEADCTYMDYDTPLAVQDFTDENNAHQLWRIYFGEPGKVWIQNQASHLYMGYDIGRSMVIQAQKEDEKSMLFEIKPFFPYIPPPTENQEIKTCAIPGAPGEFIVDIEDIPSISWAATKQTYGNGITDEIAGFKDWQLADETKAKAIANSFKDSGDKLPKGLYWCQSPYVDSWNRDPKGYPFWPVLFVNGQGDAEVHYYENFHGPGSTLTCKLILWRKAKI